MIECQARVCIRSRSCSFPWHCFCCRLFSQSCSTSLPHRQSPLPVWLSSDSPSMLQSVENRRSGSHLPASLSFVAACLVLYPLATPESSHFLKPTMFSLRPQALACTASSPSNTRSSLLLYFVPYSFHRSKLRGAHPRKPS